MKQFAFVSTLICAMLCPNQPAFAKNGSLECEISGGTYLCKTPIGSIKTPSNTSWKKETLTFTAPNGLKLIPGTKRGVVISGREKHHVHAMTVTGTTLACQWYAKGGGIGKKTGFVRGYCAVSANK